MWNLSCKDNKGLFPGKVLLCQNQDLYADVELSTTFFTTAPYYWMFLMKRDVIDKVQSYKDYLSTCNSMFLLFEIIIIPLNYFYC